VFTGKLKDQVKFRAVGIPSLGHDQTNFQFKQDRCKTLQQKIKLDMYDVNSINYQANITVQLVIGISFKGRLTDQVKFHTVEILSLGYDQTNFQVREGMQI
jgi:hypothetical protein